MKITSSRIMFLDVESTHLHGEAFAVGALLADAGTGKVLEVFELMAEDGLEDCVPWVVENVLPHLGDLPRCGSRLELRQRFWDWYVANKAECSVWADCAFPVETNFLSAVARDNLGERSFEMPFPLMDLGNFLEPTVDREVYSGLTGLRRHHPVDDCRMSLGCLMMVREGLRAGI